MAQPQNVKSPDEEIASDVGTEEIDDGLVEVINISGREVLFNVGRERRVRLKPQQKTRLEKLYALPQQGINPNGDPVPSVVEMLTDGAVVASTHRKAKPFYKNTAALREKAEETRRLQAEAKANRG